MSTINITYKSRFRVAIVVGVQCFDEYAQPGGLGMYMHSYPHTVIYFALETTPDIVIVHLNGVMVLT